MISEALILEFALLIGIYFKYFGNVIFISYDLGSSNKWEYQDLATELQKQLPEYTVYSGCIKPPGVFLFVVIFALQFLFKGLHKLFWRIFAMNTKKKLIITGFLLFVTLGSLAEGKNYFGIHYEGYTVYSKNMSDMEIPNVAQLVDIIKKNTQGFTFPKGIAVAGSLYVIKNLQSPGRRR